LIVHYKQGDEDLLFLMDRFSASSPEIFPEDLEIIERLLLRRRVVSGRILFALYNRALTLRTLTWQEYLDFYKIIYNVNRERTVVLSESDNVKKVALLREIKESALKIQP
jgi:hypothetical protein